MIGQRIRRGDDLQTVFRRANFFFIPLFSPLARRKKAREKSPSSRRFSRKPFDHREPCTILLGTFRFGNGVYKNTIFFLENVLISSAGPGYYPITFGARVELDFRELDGGTFN